MTGARKTAANMTWRELLSQQVFQKIRAKGQSNPSPEFLYSQLVPTVLWDIYRMIKSGIIAGWTSKLQKQPAASAWYGYNYKFGIINSGGFPIVNFPELKISKGTMTQTDFTVTNTTSAQTLTLTWDPTVVDETQNADDQVLIAVANTNGTTDPQGNPQFFLDMTASRADGTTVVTLPAGTYVAADNIAVYLGFRGVSPNDNAGTSSTSIYKNRTASA